jgi:RNA polymerase subunit RPABC4/transcription elongation factor Spt4
MPYAARNTIQLEREKGFITNNMISKVVKVTGSKKKILCPVCKATHFHENTDELIVLIHVLR